jgi:hypothetical protein
MVELGWSAPQFWAATVPEFWAAVDYMVERNLDQEEDYEAARAAAHRQAPASAWGDTPFKNPTGGAKGGVVTNPDLRVPDLPGWHEWAARAKRDMAEGRVKIIRVGVDPPPLAA